MIHWPVAPLGNLVRVGLQRTPDVRNESVFVADRLDMLCRIVSGTSEQNSATSEERFKIVFRRSESGPDFRGDGSLAAEVWKGCD